MPLHTFMLVLALVAIGPGAARAEPGDGPGDATMTLARELARMRGEVESLAGAIARDKDDRRARLQGLTDQASQIELEARREALRRDELARRLAGAKARLAERAAAQAGLAPAVRAALERVREAVAASLPFRQAERLAEIDKLLSRLGDGTLPPAQAWARTWELVEDELRLGRESGLDRQIVTLPRGEQRLVQVLRVGMVALYYRAGEREVGQAVVDRGAWRFEAFTDEADVARVEALFDSFGKRVETGAFELPVLPGGIR